LDAGRTGFHPVANVLGTTRDCSAIPPYDGGTPTLKPAELTPGALGISVCAQDSGDPVARLERGADRDQNRALGLAGKSLEPNPLGRCSASGAPDCQLRSRARRATGLSG
jgi:hypothetical protein